VLRHFDAYLEYIYPLPCLAVFHPSTVYQEIQVCGHRPLL